MHPASEDDDDQEEENENQSKEKSTNETWETLTGAKKKLGCTLSVGFSCSMLGCVHNCLSCRNDTRRWYVLARGLHGTEYESDIMAMASKNLGQKN